MNTSSRQNKNDSSGGLLRSLGKFTTTGVLSAAVDFGSFQLFRMALNPALSNILAMSLSLILNFTLNRAWSFRAHGRLGRSAVLYFALFFVNLIITTFAIARLADIGMDDRVAKLIVMSVISGWNFVLYRKVIFRPHTSGDGT